MRPLEHYPAEGRWWRRQRCACGLRLWRCPDWHDTLRELRDASRTLSGPYAAGQRLAGRSRECGR